MKFLVHNEAMASEFIYKGLGKVLIERGNEFILWDDRQNCAFDAFNSVKPDIFIGQGYNLDSATIKCLNNNPTIRIFLKVGIDSEEFLAEYEPEKYPILTATDKEKTLVDQIKNKDRIVVFNYCHNKRKDYVIGGWEKLGYKTWGFLPAADTYTYFPTNIDPVLESDIAFIGGYWEYKAKNLDRYIIPLCYPVGKYKIKIFGNQHWSVPQYGGFVSDNILSKIISSAKICPNIHEPHSNRYSFKLSEEIFVYI